MESGNSFKCAVRMKEESTGMSLIQNNCEMINEKPDLKNFQFLPIPRNISTRTFRKGYKNHVSELEDKMEIVFECKDVKPLINSSAVKKIDDYSQNYLRNLADSDDCKTRSLIKIEPTEEVKQEFVANFSEESNLNFDCELVEQKNKKGARKEFNNEHRLKKDTDTVHKDITYPCEISKNKFSDNSKLNRPIKSFYQCVIHSCDTCGKTFSQQEHLKTHIYATHKVITYNACDTCDICGKTFCFKTSLQTDIDEIHNRIRHPCDVCRKTFPHKSYLKTHINVAHMGVTYSCDICGKNFSDKRNLKKHIESVHNKITHACNICGKSFTQKCHLKIHIDTAHMDVTYPCDICEKNFSDKRNLKRHIDSVHNDVTLHAKKNLHEKVDSWSTLM